MKEQLFKAVRSTGTEVSDEHFKDRGNVCKGCPNFRMLKVLDVMGCGVCKCPLETKGRLWTYFSPSKMAVIRAECPIGLWKETDNSYSHLYENSSAATDPG